MFKTKEVVKLVREVLLEKKQVFDVTVKGNDCQINDKFERPYYVRADNGKESEYYPYRPSLITQEDLIRNIIGAGYGSSNKGGATTFIPSSAITSVTVKDITDAQD